MLTHRTVTASRQLIRSGYPAYRGTAPVIGRRMQSSGDSTPEKPKAKLTFRFGAKDVPVELWPMGAVVVAGIIGAGFAISRHFYKDDDLRLSRNIPAAK